MRGHELTANERITPPRRTVLRGLVGSLTATGLVARSSTSVLASEHRYVTETFDDVAIGEYPDGWTKSGYTDQAVVEPPDGADGNVLRMSGNPGGCWEALADVGVSIPADGTTTIAGRIRPTDDGERGCYDYRADVALRTSDGWWNAGEGRSLLTFDIDGTVTGSAIELGTYDVGTWNEFEITYRRTGGTVELSYVINGNERGETTVPATEYEDELSVLRIGSGEFTLYVDEVSVNEGGTDETSRGTEVQIRGDAVYVWSRASDIVGNSDQTLAFIRTLNAMDVSRVFLSWGALPAAIQDASDTRLYAFIDRCRRNGIAVEILWGVQRGIAGIEQAWSDLPTIRAHGVDGIHYDLEPKSAESRTTTLAGFLDTYAQFLDVTSFGHLDVRLYINPYWHEIEPELAGDLRDHSAVDSLVIAAYRDSVASCRERLQLALGTGAEKPYYAAFEFQNPATSAATPPTSFWDEGTAKAMEVLGDISDDPPSDRYQGTALHTYTAVTSDHYE